MRDAGIAGWEEVNDDGPDGAQHQAASSPSLEPAIGTAALPVGSGGEGDRQERQRLKRGVEFRKAPVDDKRREDERERSGRGDRQAGEATRGDERAPEGPSGI